GRLDLYVTNFYRETDTLYLNRGDLLFEEDAARAGLAEPTRSLLGWGSQAVDLDLDGRLELFLTNGHLDDRRDEGHPWKMPPQLFYNLGGGRFSDVSRDAGEFFQGEYLGRGVARLDWNRDALPDLVVVHQDRPVALLTNETEPAGNHLVLELHGVQSNRDAIGARIRATWAESTQVLEICGGDGFMATNERRQIMGIGSAARVDILEIRWPSGREDRWRDIPVNSDIVLIEGRPPLIRGIDHAIYRANRR
ncbi:MAG TPA: CRTAC1 family protein, partial [Planctomycetaceae bacterium]